jgi:hypothetical protein
VNRNRALAIGGSAALLAGGIALHVHEGPATSGGDDGGPRGVVERGQPPTIEPPARSASAVPRIARATRDAALRAQVATAIAAARARRDQAKAAAAPAGGPLAVGPETDEHARLPVTKEQIRTGVREVIPMLADCYQAELLDPGHQVEGTVTAHLIVESDPDIGAIVSMNVAHDTELDLHGEGDWSRRAGVKEALADFRSCLHATLESVALPPLPAGGRLEITYTFVFATDDEAAGGGSGSGEPTPSP